MSTVDGLIVEMNVILVTQNSLATILCIFHYFTLYYSVECI